MLKVGDHLVQLFLSNLKCFRYCHAHGFRGCSSLIDKFRLNNRATRYLNLHAQPSISQTFTKRVDIYSISQTLNPLVALDGLSDVVHNVHIVKCGRSLMFGQKLNFSCQD